MYYVAMQTRHNKPKAQGESGQISQNESPIHHSNVMLYSQDQKVRSKVGYRYASASLCLCVVDVDYSGLQNQGILPSAISLTMLVLL